MKNKYFKVICKCGHVGKKYFIRISFPVVAMTKKEAAEIARYIPRVKHNHKDAIIDCIEISYSEYIELKAINNNDPYLNCGCKQEQKIIENLYSRLEKENEFLNRFYRRKKDSIEYRLKKQNEVNNAKWWYHLDIWEKEFCEQFVY